MEEQPENPKESITKPKAKRTLTDEQRLALAQRMRAVNDKRIADAMAKKQASQPAPVEPAPIETPKSQKKKRIVHVLELTDNEESSESEEEIVIVPKKKAVKTPQPKPVARRQKKPQPVYEEEEEEEPAQRRSIAKPRKQPVEPEPPKILYRFL
jgi:hypothetical protein